ncbi:uncharacterized protein [Diadema setosum]|uniref:uncharacterized protein n=1 Tax=Diadema setosum TaxID=31175 RepID=UPI003B3BAE52
MAEEREHTLTESSCRATTLKETVEGDIEVSSYDKQWDDEARLSGSACISDTGEVNTNWTKRHGLWCRMKTLSLATDRANGVGRIRQGSSDGSSALTLGRMRRCRRQTHKLDEKALLFLKMEREMKRQSRLFETRRCELQDRIRKLQDDVRSRDECIAKDSRKLECVQLRLTAARRESARLNWVLSLAKIQGRAQQEVVDSKQDDVIKMAVRQAELREQIRKLKLTIETLENKEAENGYHGNKNRCENTAEHPGSELIQAGEAENRVGLPVIISSRQAVDITREGDHNGNQTASVRQHSRTHVWRRGGTTKSKTVTRLVKVSRGITASSIRLKQQRARNASLRKDVKGMAQRIQTLLDDRARARLFLANARQRAEAIVGVCFNGESGPVRKTMASGTSTTPQKNERAFYTKIHSTASPLLLEEMSKMMRVIEELEGFLSNDDKSCEIVTKVKIRREKTSDQEKTTTRADVGDAQNTVPLSDKIRMWESRQKEADRAFTTRRCCSRTAAKVRGDRPQGSISNPQLRGAPRHGDALGTMRGVVVGRVPRRESNADRTSEDNMKECERRVGMEKEVKGNEISALNVRKGVDFPLTVRKTMETTDLTTAIVRETSSPREVSVKEIGKDVGGKISEGSRMENSLEVIQRVSDLLVDKWCLEGQVKALADNEQALAASKEEISSRLDAANRELAKSASDSVFIRQRNIDNIASLQKEIAKLSEQLQETEERLQTEESSKIKLRTVVGEWQRKVAELEAKKVKLEGEVEAWMETVMEVRKGRIALLDRMEDITNKVGRLERTSTWTMRRESCNPHSDRSCNASRNYRDDNLSLQDCRKQRSDTSIRNLRSEITTLSRQKREQETHIEQLSMLLQTANDEKQSLAAQLAESEQEKRDLQSDFDHVHELLMSSFPDEISAKA